MKSDSAHISDKSNKDMAVGRTETGERLTRRPWGSHTGRSIILLVLLLCGLYWSSMISSRRNGAIRDGGFSMGDSEYSKDVVKCSGYTLSDLEETDDGATARLTLAGPPANAFGHDIKDLILEVKYQSESRLHVHIYDAAKMQYQIPAHVLPRAPSTKPSQHNLQFHHETSPFAFWITRSTGEVIFDTRPENIPVHTEFIERNGKVLRDSGTPAYPLVFSDQYLQLATAVPNNTNIYGLGEIIATDGIRINNGTIVTFWNRDSGGSPADENLYGSHPFYLETRYDESAHSLSHGVFMMNSHGMDVLIRSGLVEYRILGGTLDMYFLSGPTPKAVVEQYSDVVGKPAKMPFWAFGFHMCRWKHRWSTLDGVREVVEQMKKENIPLETVWSDLDYMDRYRDFTVNDDFSPEKFREFTDWLHERHQHYIPLVDAAIGTLTDENDSYKAYEGGKDLDVYIKNEDGTDFVGRVWPGPTVFPDWTAKNVQEWWQEAFDDFKAMVNYDGIWLDMNEPASLKTQNAAEDDAIMRQSKKAKTQRDMYDFPPYDIHNGWESLADRTVPPSSILANGTRQYHSHNLWGYQENLATNEVLKKQEPAKRPFIVSRSSFAGHGRVSAHWLGDNYSTWKSMRESIQGVLQFQLFQIPMVGPDACGFSKDSTDELCNRWMQLSAFYPFYRNHNDQGATDQEPFVWPSVAEASRKAMEIRYRLLPYWETLFAQASRSGTPPLRPIFFEFDDPRYTGVETQFLVGSALLVTPVLHESSEEVTGYFPSTSGVTWRDWYTQEILDVNEGDEATLPTPLGHINVHIRSGSIIPTHTKAEYTLTETRAGNYSLIVSLDENGMAEGEAVLDDGMSPDSDETIVTFFAQEGSLTLRAAGGYEVPQFLEQITVLGAKAEPKSVTLSGEEVSSTSEWDDRIGRVLVTGLSVKLDGEKVVAW